ncbi:MAG: translational GTPase TypA [Phycisphaeraceae bacterium]|nr:translational GTPase TypA [Phycisphaeraceae bacterium]
MSPQFIRNVAVIAHVDHGKTTLTDQMLYQSGMFRHEQLDKLAGGQHHLIMDTGDLERERGITITSKNCSVSYKSLDGNTYKVNLIDTPGHADFGGEVERVLSMADGALLLVDAFEGPMPQTRFVLSKALGHHLKLVLVVNKIDKPNARPDEVVNEVFDLLVKLDAPDDILDFPIIYASARDGWATADHGKLGDDHPSDIRDLFETIVQKIPAPYAREGQGAAEAAREGSLAMMVSSLIYSDYVGKIAVGRVHHGHIRPAQQVTVIDRHGKSSKQKVLQVLAFEGLSRQEAPRVEAGDLCAVVGLEKVDIGDTITCPENPRKLKSVAIDEPTLNMIFRVNDGPFAGREGTYVTSRQIGSRLETELQSNVALRVAPGNSAEQFDVSGRGLMHLGVLLETMRREGYELCVGKPRVIYKEIEGKTCEPIEQLVVDCPHECQNDVMALVCLRRAEIVSIDPRGDYAHMAFTIPARGLIGLRSRMLTATQGRAVMHHNLLRYEPLRGEVPSRAAGVMVSLQTGRVTAYSLDRLYDRGVFFVRPGDQVYEGQIVGEHCKENDITVNLTINKKLSNMRATGSDDATRVRPARDMSLEACLEYIEEDELVELTPDSVRMRKQLMSEADRRRQERRAKS